MVLNPFDSKAPHSPQQYPKGSMISPVDPDLLDNDFFNNIFYALFLRDKILEFGTTRKNVVYIQYKNACGAISLYGHTMRTSSHYQLYLL